MSNHDTTQHGSGITMLGGVPASLGTAHFIHIPKSCNWWTVLSLIYLVVLCSSQWYKKLIC